MVGPNCEPPYSLPELCAAYNSHELRPCLETLTPWPWASSEKRQVGSVLCDMYCPDGTPDLNCPRQQLQHQLKALRAEHGLVVRTAFEYEFFAFKENTLEPLGSDRMQFLDLRVWGRHQDLMSELRETLQAMKVKVRTVQPEFPPGQWELTTSPYQGVTGADVGFYVKNAVKGFLGTRGYDATFMTRPTTESIGSGLHLNHSLWRPHAANGEEGEEEEGGDNVLVGADSDGLAPLARHWMAGLLTHAPALTALLSPTLNCYRRLHTLVSPSLATWGMDDRNAVVRVRRLKKDNVFLENRLASGAASPYLALAATVAAGRDGLRRGLQCPRAMEKSGADEIPRTLTEALTALEGDRELGSLLGEDFVRCYVQAKREVEVGPYEQQVGPYEQQVFANDDDRIAFERNMYFKTY